jgi:acetylornithine deacetylase
VVAGAWRDRGARYDLEKARSGVGLTETEGLVTQEIRRRRDDLVALAAALVGFDTTSRDPDDPPRDEADLQDYLAGRLRAAGAEAEVWEPKPEDVAGSRLIPDGLRFEGRPQMVARFPGMGGGPSLLLNGHIDAVPAGPPEEWTSDPFRARVREGNLYGRGSLDMKGGIAAMVFAAEVLASLGLRLAGDLVICTVTDEESTGAGGVAAVAHGVRADAGIVAESTSFDVSIAYSGSLLLTVTVPGRPGHVSVEQPHWEAGGAVNAIDKADVIRGALGRLREEWRGRPDHEHPYLSRSHITATTITGGEWIVSYPSSCRLSCHVGYLPTHADEDGWGTAVQAEIVDRIERAARADAWLAENPPTIEWGTEVPAAEVSAEEPIVRTMLAAGADIGLSGRLKGSGWVDAATFTRSGTPSICFGPGDGKWAHAFDEHVPIDELVHAAQALAVAALRFCGEARKADGVRELRTDRGRERT